MQGSEVAPAGETHPRQSLLGSPRCRHSDKVTHVPAVTAHSPSWLCASEHSSLSPACLRDRPCQGEQPLPRDCPGTTVFRELRKQPNQAHSWTRLCSISHVQCGPCPPPRSSRVGIQGRGGLGESVLLRGCSLGPGTWQEPPVPPELGQKLEGVALPYLIF